MKFIQRTFTAHLLVSVTALGVGYAVAGFLWLSFLFLFIGGVWFTARMRNASGLEGLILAIFMIAAGLGVLFGVPAWLMLFTVVASLGAWDLGHFLQRLSEVEQVEFESGIGRQHLNRLLLVEGLGFLAGLLALTTRLGIPFWWEALLALMAVLGIRGLISYVRKQADR